MKKQYYLLQVWTCMVLMGIVCSCGNSIKTKVDDQSIKDSIVKVIKDSIDSKRTYSAEAILKRVNEMFGNDDFFSEEYKKANKELQDFADKYRPDDIVGPDYIVWDTSQGGCGEGKTEFGDVQDITESTAVIKVFNKFECDENHDVVLHLVFENGDWFVDDISNSFSKSLKNDMKKELKDIVNSSN